MIQIGNHSKHPPSGTFQSKSFTGIQPFPGFSLLVEVNIITFNVLYKFLNERYSTSFS